MLKYILKRLGVAIPTLLLLIIFSFVLMRLAPGGPFNSERPLPPQALANIEAKFGLDQPWHLQLWAYMVGIITRFDFGPSFAYTDRTVNDIIAQGFPVTLTYGTWSFVLAVLLGCSLGIAAAVRHNSWLDHLSVGTSIGAVIMPVIALGTSYMASIARITRSSMLEVLNSNFIRTARAKGMPARHVIIRHALKPALMPLLSYLGPAFVGMVTGSVIIDVYFSTGGIGQLFTNSAFNRDYSVIMGITILLGTLTIAFNLIVDILYAWIDPRIRY